MHNISFQSLLLWINIFFVALVNKKLLLPLQCRLNKNFLRGFGNLIGYFASAIKVVSSNPYVGLSPRIKICFLLLSICTDEFISAQKIMTIFAMIKSGNENSERESNPMP